MPGMSPCLSHTHKTHQPNPKANNLTFASVHDSYWTHAATVDEMSGIIRDTFIALHSSDVLKKLHEEVRLFSSPLLLCRNAN